MQLNILHYTERAAFDTEFYLVQHVKSTKLEKHGQKKKKKEEAVKTHD